MFKVYSLVFVPVPVIVPVIVSAPAYGVYWGMP